MSRNSKCPNPLTIHEINKLLLTDNVKPREEHECAGYGNKFRDENYKEYKEKLRQYTCCAQEYKNMNKRVEHTDQAKLESHYLNMKFPFLDNFLPGDVEIDIKEFDNEGRQLRRRPVREIHTKPDAIEDEKCFVEPWVKRYAKLGKFVQAARTIVIKNRLLKNLEKLKKLNEDNVEDFDTMKKQCCNVSYEELFDKFLEA